MFNLYTAAKAISGLGQLAGAAQYAHRQYTGGNTPSRPSYSRRYKRMRPSPYRRPRRRYRRSFYRSRYAKRMPMLRPRFRSRLRKAKFAPVGGVQRFKTQVLNHTLDLKFVDKLSNKNFENDIHFIDVLKKQWIPERSDMPYDKTLTFETHEQCRLKAVIIELRNFNERRLIRYSDDRVEERSADRMLFRYYWDSNDMLGQSQSSDIRPNFNKLNKRKYVPKQSIKPSFTYKYIPKYGLNEGWCEFQNASGYGTYNALLDVHKTDFKSLINIICSKPVNRFVVNDGDTSATVDQPQFLPRFFYSHETEYDSDQFDKKEEAYLQDVNVHMNFELNIKSIWEFKNPRIDPLV